MPSFIVAYAWQILGVFWPHPPHSSNHEQPGNCPSWIWLKLTSKVCQIEKFKEKQKSPNLGAKWPDKFWTKNGLFAYFWDKNGKYFSHIWNQLPHICLFKNILNLKVLLSYLKYVSSSLSFLKFGAKIKIFKFWTKNVLFA